jgi:hypothetical protein
VSCRGFWRCHGTRANLKTGKRLKLSFGKKQKVCLSSNYRLWTDGQLSESAAIRGTDRPLVLNLAISSLSWTCFLPLFLEHTLNSLLNGSSNEADEIHGSLLQAPCSGKICEPLRRSLPSTLRSPSQPTPPGVLGTRRSLQSCAVFQYKLNVGPLHPFQSVYNPANVGESLNVISTPLSFP